MSYASPIYIHPISTCGWYRQQMWFDCSFLQNTIHQMLSFPTLWSLLYSYAMPLTPSSLYSYLTPLTPSLSVADTDNSVDPTVVLSGTLSNLYCPLVKRGSYSLRVTVTFTNAVVTCSFTSNCRRASTSSCTHKVRLFHNILSLNFAEDNDKKRRMNLGIKTTKYKQQ